MTFHGQFQPPVDEYLLTQFFKEKNNGFFIECGAADGVTDSNCLFFEQERSWDGINIEASAAGFEKLQINRPWSVNLHCALGAPEDSGKRVSFSHTKHPDIAAFYNGAIEHTDEHLADLQRQGVALTQEEVIIKCYQDIIQECGVCHVDLLSLDIEGYELKVLSGLTDPFPCVICVEFSHVGLHNLNKLLGKFSYKFHSTSFVNAFYTKSS